MTIELTARLTLSSCVSQLTDFFATDIMPTIVDCGYHRLIIRLCDNDGQVLPYRIEITPELAGGTFYNLRSLSCLVFFADSQDLDTPFNIRFTANIEKTGDSTSLVYRCALHVCGDFIKFNEKQGRI